MINNISITKLDYDVHDLLFNDDDVKVKFEPQDRALIQN